MSRTFTFVTLRIGAGLRVIAMPLCLLLFVSCSGRAIGQPRKNVLFDGAPTHDTDIKPRDVVQWEGIDATSYSDGRVVVNLRLTTKQDFTLYDSKVSFIPPPGFSLEEWHGPPTRELVDPVMGKVVNVYYGGEFELQFVGPRDDIGPVFPLTIKYLGCTSRICLFPYSEVLEIPLTKKPISEFISVSAPTPSHAKPKATETIEPPLKVAIAQQSRQPSIGLPEKPEDEDIEEGLVSRMKGHNLPLRILLLFAFLGGILTNLTPCVYPMIPITIRVLARQGKSPFLASVAYGSGILLTYTSLGVFASLSGSLFGSIMASPAFNLVFGVIMLVFGITMLGYGDLSILQNLGNRVGVGKASVKNAFLMGTGAGLVASPCTGPVLAFFLGYSAKEGNVLHGIALLFTYSFGFALPYVFLGGVAAKAGAIKVSPRVQVGVKAGFAAVMFALGFYYFRIPAYGFLKLLGAHWQNLTIFSLAAGLLAGGVIVLIPRLLNQKAALVLPAVLLGFGIFSGSQWLSEKDQSSLGQALVWLQSEPEALRIANERKLPVFIDNGAEWCEACKKMEATTFTDPNVIKFLGSGDWVLLKLDLTETNSENDRLMEKYEIRSLPTLTILKRGGGLDGRQSILGFVSGAGLVNQLRNIDVE